VCLGWSYLTLDLGPFQEMEVAVFVVFPIFFVNSGLFVVDWIIEGLPSCTLGLN
jgi:hypothetical protein